MNEDVLRDLLLLWHLKYLLNDVESLIESGYVNSSASGKRAVT